MNPLLSFLSNISPLQPETLHSIQPLIEQRIVAKETHLLSPGQIATRLYFIEKGLGRVYYKVGEKDISDYFAREAQFIGAVESLFTGMPGKKGIEILEPSTLWSFPYRDLEQLCFHHPDLERLARKLAVIGFLESQSRLEGILCKDAPTRLAELQEQHPQLLQRVPLKHIASYLGITPVSLSRIRAAEINK